MDVSGPERGSRRICVSPRAPHPLAASPYHARRSQCGGIRRGTGEHFERGNRGHSNGGRELGQGRASPLPQMWRSCQGYGRSAARAGRDLTPQEKLVQAPPVGGDVAAIGGGGDRRGHGPACRWAESGGVINPGWSNALAELPFSCRVALSRSTGSSSLGKVRIRLMRVKLKPRNLHYHGSATTLFVDPELRADKSRKALHHSFFPRRLRLQMLLLPTYRAGSWPSCFNSRSNSSSSMILSKGERGPPCVAPSSSELTSPPSMAAC